MIEFKHDIEQVFLFLDRSCNLNCKYCFQKHFDKTPNLQINPDVLKFLKYLRQKNNFIVTLYGGEFFNNPNSISVLKQIGDMGIRLEVISNGKLLNDELINLFNKYKVCLNLSWDGQNSIYTRNYNFFDKNTDLFLKLKTVPRINSIITKYTYPLDIIKDVEVISNKYKEIYNQDVRFHLNMLFNNGLSEEMQDIDINRIYNEMYEVTKRYIDDKFNNKTTLITNCLDPILLRNAYDYYVNSKGELKDSFKCMDGKVNLTLDILGNLYECCDFKTKLCTIYDTYDTYYDKLQCKERDQRCNNCEVVGFCCGFCKLIPEEFKEWHCKVRKSFLKGIMDALNNEYNSRNRS